MDKFQRAVSNHEITQPNYKLWGIDGHTAIHRQTTLDPIILNILGQTIDLENYQLICTFMVDYYQGFDLETIKAVWLRFIRKDGKHNKLYGEHISAVFNLSNRQLLGLTKMQYPNNDPKWITHQEALEQALRFLQNYAPDLVRSNIEIPLLNKTDIMTRLEFNPVIKLDKLELNWIDIHGEKIVIDNQIIWVKGIKIKMYIPDTKLWAWVIVSPDGAIMTFERNISWDFDKMQRQTQMWLHDGWLDSQAINVFKHIYGLN